MRVHVRVTVDTETQEPASIDSVFASLPGFVPNVEDATGVILVSRWLAAAGHPVPKEGLLK